METKTLSRAMLAQNFQATKSKPVERSTAVSFGASNKVEDIHSPVFSVDKQANIIKYGKNNLYPDFLLDLFLNKSGKHRAIIEKKVTMIAGQGWEYNEKNEEAKREKCRLAALGNKNRLGQTWKLSEEAKKKGNKGWFKKGQPSHLIGKHINVRENNPNWIADRSLLKKKEERNDSAYRDWRYNIWQRDGFKCKIADGNCKGKIEAHHILAWKDYPELRYKINNGITLCHAHHPRKRADETKLSPYFKQLVAEKS